MLLSVDIYKQVIERTLEPHVDGSILKASNIQMLIKTPRSQQKQYAAVESFPIVKCMLVFLER